MIPLLLLLTGAVGAGLGALALYFWPSLMGWAREHLLPWVERVVPNLANDVRVAFQNLDRVAVDVRRTVRSAWHRLRRVLLSEVADFVQLVDDSWAVRITSYLRNAENAAKPVTKIVSEQPIGYDDLPDEIRVKVLTGGLRKASLDIVELRDRLLEETL
ncbi:hypothetical protein ACFC6L_03210 [Kitasatospora phosalacinea]|uniref:hypothetical protein n=1 Tax=Kitasatospora phosalacinea TaxID=2065 RepID=UPI0035DA9D1D